MQTNYGYSSLDMIRTQKNTLINNHILVDCEIKVETKFTKNSILFMIECLKF